MADSEKKFDPNAKSGELRALRIADAVRQRAEKKFDSSIRAGKEKIQSQAQRYAGDVESGLQERVGKLANGRALRTIDKVRASSQRGDYSAQLKEAGQRKLREKIPQLQDMRGRLARFEEDEPEFSSYARKKFEQAQEDGDLKKTAEGVVEDAKGLRDAVEAASLTGQLKIYAKTALYSAKLANFLDEQIQKGNSSWWILAVVLAMGKDVFDALANGVPFLGKVANTAISIGFIVFFAWFLWGKGAFLFKFLIKRVLLMMSFEFIPIVDILPLYTITILYAWRKSNNKMASLTKARKKLNK